MILSASMFLITTFKNFQVWEPVRYDAECTGALAGSNSSMTCFASLIWPKWLCHMAWNWDSFSTKGFLFSVMERMSHVFCSNIYLTERWRHVLCGYATLSATMNLRLVCSVPLQLGKGHFHTLQVALCSKWYCVLPPCKQNFHRSMQNDPDSWNSHYELRVESGWSSHYGFWKFHGKCYHLLVGWVHIFCIEAVNKGIEQLQMWYVYHVIGSNCQLTSSISFSGLGEKNTGYWCGNCHTTLHVRRSHGLMALADWDWRFFHLIFGLACVTNEGAGNCNSRVEWLRGFGWNKNNYRIGVPRLDFLFRGKDVVDQPVDGQCFE